MCEKNKTTNGLMCWWLCWMWAVGNTCLWQDCDFLPPDPLIECLCIAYRPTYFSKQNAFELIIGNGNREMCLMSISVCFIFLPIPALQSVINYGRHRHTVHTMNQKWNIFIQFFLVWKLLRFLLEKQTFHRKRCNKALALSSLFNVCTLFNHKPILIDISINR